MFLNECFSWLRLKIRNDMLCDYTIIVIIIMLNPDYTSLSVSWLSIESYFQHCIIGQWYYASCGWELVDIWRRW